MRCIDSVLHQTYRHLEVILVDDCSPDRSMAIAREHILQSPLSKDLKFVYLTHERNRGLSAARNTGIDAATGEYVYFLDSDDEITENCIEVLAKPLEQKRYDFVVGNYKNIGEYNYYQPLGFSGEIVGQEKIAQSYLERKWYPMAWNKLCRNSYLKGNGLYFQEGLIHEDELWSFQLACTAISIFGVNAITYYYIIRENSITTTGDYKKKERKVQNYLKVLQSMYEFQEKHHLYQPIVWKLQCKFRKSVYYEMQTLGLSLKETYSYLHIVDIRRTITKLKIYPSCKEKLLNLDTFMSNGIGYLYRLFLRKYFACRTHDKNYPFIP